MPKENLSKKDTEPPDEPLSVMEGFSEENASAYYRYQEAILHSKMLTEKCSSIEKANTWFEDIIFRVKVTFWSILTMNMILIIMGVFMFGGAFYGAIGGRFDITAVLTATGFGSILTVFTFSMNRVQTSLGDQVQVQVAYNAFMKQILNFDEHFKFKLETKQIKEINEEIRKTTLTTNGIDPEVHQDRHAKCKGTMD